MRVMHAAVLAGLSLGLVSGAAEAAYVVDIDQVGANVVTTGSGSIDLSAFTFTVTTSNYQAGIVPSFPALTIGAKTLADLYRGTISGPTNFGTGYLTFANDSTGPEVALLRNGFLLVPDGYISGTSLGLTTATFTNATFDSLGLALGQYTYFFPTGGEGTDTFTINVGSVSPVPLPASAPMFGAALLALGAVGYGVKRKKAAAAA